METHDHLYLTADRDETLPQDVQDRIAKVRDRFAFMLNRLRQDKTLLDQGEFAELSEANLAFTTAYPTMKPDAWRGLSDEDGEMTPAGRSIGVKQAMLTFDRFKP